MRSTHLIALYYLNPISVKFAFSNNKIDEFRCVVNICQIAAVFSSKKEIFSLIIFRLIQHLMNNLSHHQMIKCI